MDVKDMFTDPAFNRYQLFHLAATLTAGQNKDLSVRDSVALMMQYVAALEQADDDYRTKQVADFAALRKP